MLTAACLIIFSIVSWVRPVAAYGIALALLPAYLVRYNFFGLPTTFLELMVGIFLAVLAVKFWGRRREALMRIRSLGRFNWLVLAFLLAAGISTLLSPEPVKALGQLKAYFIEPVLFFYAGIILLKSEEDLKLPLRLVFWSAVGLSVFSLLQHPTHIFLPLKFWGYGEEVKRVTGPFEHPNALALYLAPLFVLFVSLQAAGYRLARHAWLGWAGALAVFSALVLTFSRGAWLAMFVGLLLLVLQSKKLFNRKGVLAGVLILAVLSPLFAGRLKTTFSDAASSERLGLYQAAGRKILQNPLLGNGLYGFRTTLEQSAGYAGEVLNFPHNIILHFWLETGLLGLASFFLIIFFSLKRLRHNPSAIGLSAGLFLAAVVVHGLVDGPYFKNDLSMLFWAVLTWVHLKK